VSLVSPLGRVLGLGSAREGSHHWYAQRVSSVAQALLGVWFIAALAMLGGVDLERLRAWIASPLVATLLLLFIATLAWHTILGLQVVIEDYVGAKGVRVAVLIAIKFGFVLAAVVAAIAVLRLAIGAVA
jgi:succinate dehydrogenase / fumarate reductase, membrane anchor subunit